MKKASTRRLIVYFFYFLAVNIFLSYFTGSLSVKFFGGCLGVLLPLALAAFFEGNSPGKAAEAGGKGILTFPPLLGTPLLILAVLLPRLWGLTTLSTWPMPDDGLFAYYSAGLSQEWTWQFFFSHAQNPPLFNWGLALFFKAVRPGLFSLWLFPALISILTLVVAALGARKFFGASSAFLFLLLGSMDFFLLYAGRFCLGAGLFLFWEVLCLALLAFWLKSPPGNGRRLWFFCLSLALGLGFFVTTIWALAGLLVLLPVWRLRPWAEKKEGVGAALFFVPPVFLALVYAVVSVLGKNGLYLQHLLAFKTGTDWKTHGLVSQADLTALFWGTPWKFFYGPLWGGMLNPVAGALFFLGLLEGFRRRKQPLVQWAFLGVFLLFAPVFLLQNFEFFRVLGAWPFVLILAVWGLEALLAAFPARLRLGIALLVLAASSGLDLYHLWGPYHRLWGTPSPQWSNLKSIEYWRAEQVLEKNQAEQGLGLLFSDFQPFVTDQTLSIAAFDLDPGIHSGLSLEGRKWVAILLDAHFKPFLGGEFPQSRWYWLGDNHMSGGLVLAVVPLDEKDRSRLQKWLEADELMGSVTQEVMGQWRKGGPDPILKRLSEVYPAIQGDRFLETCFWERVLYHQKMEGDPQACLAAIHEGLRKGYPLPPFLNDEGVFYMREGRYQEARKSFEKAVRSPLNLTPAAENLKRLSVLEKNHGLSAPHIK